MNRDHVMFTEKHLEKTMVTVSFHRDIFHSEETQIWEVTLRTGDKSCLPTLLLEDPHSDRIIQSACDYNDIMTSVSSF